MSKTYCAGQAGVPSWAENKTPASRQLHQVVDVDENVVDTFRNRVLAERMVTNNPGKYRVRSFAL